MNRAIHSLTVAVLCFILSPNIFAANALPGDDTQRVNSCDKCHGDGDAAIPGWPPIKSLSKAELVGKLTAYRDQLAPESRMSDVVHNFTDEEIEKIAEHFAHEHLAQ